MTSDADADFDPTAGLDRINAATERVVQTVAQFSDVDVRAPSLLPGWSRGHVLTHLARNADGGRRLLIWARTGVEMPEYASLAVRAEEIEAGAGRGVDELMTDLVGSATRFAGEYRRMPSAAWSRTVRWTRGQERPASRVADSRLCELLVHHVDLDAGYTPAQWPADFVQAMLGRVVASFNARDDAPAMRLHTTDTGAQHDIAAPGSGTVIRGSGSALLAWLIGRSRGHDLAVHGPGTRPEPPFLF